MEKKSEILEKETSELDLEKEPLLDEVSILTEIKENVWKFFFVFRRKQQLR